MKFLIVILSVLSVTQTVSANELTLLITRSPGIDWASPRTLAKTTVSGMTKPHGLGHVNIKVNCGNREILTGNTTRWGKDTRNLVTKEHYGLGVLFNVFEGLLDNPKFIIPSFQKLALDSRTNFVTFKVSAPTCQRLLDYHDQYQLLMKNRLSLKRASAMKANHDQQIGYGFPTLARYGEGGGCSGFAVSFLEIAGIKEQWMVNEWSQQVLVPQTTVGLPMTNFKVGLRSLLTSSPKRWALPTEPHFPLFFWDPDMMFKDTVKRALSGKVEVASLNGAPGIILDRTNIPTPSEPLFLNDPFNAPTDPKNAYKDLNELKRRYEISKQISLVLDPTEEPVPCHIASGCVQSR
jgi:hypothetical protein